MENTHVFVSLLFVLVGLHSALGGYCDEEYCSNGCCGESCCSDYTYDEDESLSGGVVAAIVIGAVLGLLFKICCWVTIYRRYYARRTIIVMQPAAASSTTVVNTTTTGPAPSTNPYHMGYNQHPMSYPAQPSMSQSAAPGPPPSYAQQKPNGPPPAYA